MEDLLRRGAWAEWVLPMANEGGVGGRYEADGKNVYGRHDTAFIWGSKCVDGVVDGVYLRCLL